jgi:hypothetical protein
MFHIHHQILSLLQMTGTLRTDPTQPLPGRTRRPFLPLNNKCMELRKVVAGAEHIRFNSSARHISLARQLCHACSARWQYWLCPPVVGALSCYCSQMLHDLTPRHPPCAAVQPPHAELPSGAGRPSGRGHHRRRVREAGPAGPHSGADVIHFFIVLV